MAKRLTDTEKWKDDWFLSLNNDYRIIWQYFLDNCNHAGIIKKNLRMLNFCCNTSILEKDITAVFNGRLVDIGENYFIPKFLTFQYEQGLASNKPVIVSVRKQLERYNLTGMIPQSLDNDSVSIKSKSKDKSKDKDKSKSKSKDNIETPEQFISSLKTNPTYKHVNIDCELGKASEWIKAHPGRKLTKLFFLNWINKVEAPLDINIRPKIRMFPDDPSTTHLPKQ